MRISKLLGCSLFLLTIVVLGAGLWVTQQRKQRNVLPPPEIAATPKVDNKSQPSHEASHTLPVQSTRTSTSVPTTLQRAVREIKAEREKERYDEPEKAAEFYRLKRVPEGEAEIPVERYVAAQERMAQMPRYSTSRRQVLPSQREQGMAGIEALPGNWEALGPGNIGGRTRALLIHPTQAQIMYAAGVAGGVWKSTNAGASWVPLTDLMANLAVSSLAFDPTNPTTIYAGTGEGFFNGDAVRGAGIFKSLDGGLNWSRIPSTNTTDFYYVNDLVISPNNSKRIYAATRTGVWRSLDGGASWSLVLGGKGGGYDLAMRSDQASDEVLAVVGTTSQTAIYRNTDAAGAGTWQVVLQETGMGAPHSRLRLPIQM